MSHSLVLKTLARGFTTGTLTQPRMSLESLFFVGGSNKILAPILTHAGSSSGTGNRKRNQNAIQLSSILFKKSHEEPGTLDFRVQCASSWQVLLLIRVFGVTATLAAWLSELSSLLLSSWLFMVVLWFCFTPRFRWRHSVINSPASSWRPCCSPLCKD